MTTMEFKRVSIQFKEVTEQGTFEGMGATFGNVDHGLDLIEAGAFKGSLRELRKRKEMPALLWSHNRDLPIGEWEEMEETDEGLFVKGMLWVSGNSKGRTPVPEAERARNMMLSNGPKGLSIGFIPSKYDFQKRKFMNPRKKDEEVEAMVRVLKTVDLMEISPVVFPMNPEARVTGAKAINLYPDKRVLEHALKDIGFTGQEAKALIAEGWDGLKRDVDDREGKRDVDLSQGDLTSIIEAINNAW